MSDLLSQASLVMIPSGYKEDVVYSVVPSDGSGDLAFTRASNGTRINSAGLVEVCPWNLLEQSQSFSTSGGAWNYTAGSGVTTGQTGYDGTSNAVLFTDSGANAVYGAYQSFSKLGAVTLSIYAKAGSTNIFNIDIFQTPLATVRVNLSTGAITSGSGVVESVGNGWYRISVTAVMTDSYYVRFGCPATGTVYIQNIQANIGSTAKPYFPTTDRLNVPRLTYQNGGGGCPSLLLEKQSTNLYFPSTPNNSASGTYVANAGISPDGTQNAASFTASGFGVLYANTITTTVQSYTWSLYLKGTVNGQKVRLGTDVATITELTLTTEWARYSVTFTGTASTYGYYILAGSYFSPAQNNLFYVWGSQIEASSYATSLINTTSSSATRVADDCYKTGISSLIGQTEGVLFADVVIPSYDNVAKWIAFLGAKNSTTFLGIYVNSSNGITAEVLNSTQQALIIYNSFSVGTRYKIALAYKQNDFAFYINGTQIGTDTSGTVPTVSEFNFNYQLIDSLMGVRNYNQVALFKTRLTNAQLASLTTI